MKFSNVILITGSNAFLIAGMIIFVDGGETEVPFVYPEAVEQNALQQVHQDRVNTEALVSVGSVSASAVNASDVPRSTPDKPEMPETEGYPSAEEDNEKDERVELMPAPTKFSLDVEVGDEIEARFEEVRVLGPGRETVMINRGAGFMVSMGNGDATPSDDVAAWPLFGNEYRARDFAGYCQVLAYVRTSGDDFLWSPTLTGVQDDDLTEIQDALADPLVREGSIDNAGDNAAFAWMVCMDGNVTSGKPFETADALARLDGVKLGPASRIATARGD